jgi:hypothetical protein
MLLLISLGWFRYLLEAFASQAGSTSIALQHYDWLCATLGRRLSRQSDRNLPRTNFPKGFSLGSNLMGHEIAGCLLVKLFALHTTSFRVIFMVGKKRKGAMPEEQRLSNKLVHIQDWILVVSSLLQRHQLLNQPTIAKEQVNNSRLATQWLIWQVAKFQLAQREWETIPSRSTWPCIYARTFLIMAFLRTSTALTQSLLTFRSQKMTSRNTQKRAVSFTKQAAHRYVENLAVTLASADVANDVKLTGSGLDTPSPTAAPADAQPSGVTAGRQFTISWKAGADSVTFSWNRKGLSNDPDKDRLPSPVTECLSEHCLPHMPNGKLPCLTEFVSVRNDLYHAHPKIYNGRAWNDHALVKWHKVKALLPAFIHAFVNLRGLPKGKSISIRSTGQTNIKAGLYALVHSLSPVDEENLSFSNTLIGQYTVHCASQVERPTLYLVDVEAIKSPTVGISDVGWTPNGHLKMQSEQHHLPGPLQGRLAPGMGFND